MAEEQKTYFQVIDYIKKLAREQKVVFGGKIPSERELMERLGLSRNSVREALRTLDNMGIIESRHGKGNFLVNHMGKSLNSVFSMLLFMKESDYLEVSALRRAMETQAYLLSMEKLDDEGRQRFADIMGRIKEADHASMVQADHDFHRALVEYSGNRLLGMMMEALSEVCQEEISLILDAATGIHTQKWLDIHKEMYHCLVSRDREGGINAVKEHYIWIDRELEKMSANTGDAAGIANRAAAYGVN
jgi:GntR family transcriptional repressor for pyruvate dehydrogenase complex